MKCIRNWLPILGICVLAGCQGSSDKYQVVAVSGTVTLDGKAVEGATVTFMPESAEGVAAAGTTDASGQYTLQTSGVEKRGAVPGTYKVTVIKQVHTEVNPSGGVPRSDGSVPVMSPAVTTESKNVLPQKYATPKESGLTATVTDGGSNTVDFPLQSK